MNGQHVTTIHEITWTDAQRVDLYHGRANVIARHNDTTGTYDTLRVFVIEPHGRIRGPIELHALDHYDNDGLRSALSYALDGNAPGLAREEQRRIADAALMLTSRVCDVCYSEWDRDCFAEIRCPECDEPCPGCHAGPGLMG